MHSNYVQLGASRPMLWGHSYVSAIHYSYIHSQIEMLTISEIEKKTKYVNTIHRTFHDR